MPTQRTGCARNRGSGREHSLLAGLRRCPPRSQTEIGRYDNSRVLNRARFKVQRFRVHKLGIHADGPINEDYLLTPVFYNDKLNIRTC